MGREPATDQPGFDYSTLDEVAHRPWPVPGTAWVMTQTWHDLLFAHWSLDAAVLRAAVPQPFELDLYDGRAWIAVVPFRMSNVAPRFVPSVPGVSAFPELNVRTYVTAGDKPGIYFFSLDAGSTLAVRAARSLLNLPYFTADMTVERDGPRVSYGSRRRSPNDPPADFAATYAPRGPVAAAVRGSLEYFLTERYCLYALDHRGRPYRLEIHHRAWPLQPADAEIVRNTMTEPHGLTLPSRPPLLHFAARQDMVAWLPETLDWR